MTVVIFTKVICSFLGYGFKDVSVRLVKVPVGRELVASICARLENQVIKFVPLGLHLVL